LVNPPRKIVNKVLRRRLGLKTLVFVATRRPAPYKCQQAKAKLRKCLSMRLDSERRPFRRPLGLVHRVNGVRRGKEQPKAPPARIPGETASGVLDDAANRLAVAITDNHASAIARARAVSQSATFLSALDNSACHQAIAGGSAPPARNEMLQSLAASNVDSASLNRDLAVTKPAFA
jgi:hypothetical protein